MNDKKGNVRFIGDADNLGVQVQLSGKEKNDQISFAKNILNTIN